MDSSPNLYDPTPTTTNNNHHAITNNHLTVSDQLILGHHPNLKSLTGSNIPSSTASTSPSQSKLSSSSPTILSRTAAGVLNAAVAELAADLNTPEISFDLQQFISSEIASAQAASASLNNILTNSQAVNLASGSSGATQVTSVPSVQVTDDSVSLFTELLNSTAASVVGSNADKRAVSVAMNGFGGNNGNNFSTHRIVDRTPSYHHNQSVDVKREDIDVFGLSCQNGGYVSSSSSYSTASSNGGNSFNNSQHQQQQQQQQPVVNHYGVSNPGLISSRSQANGHHHSSSSSSSHHPHHPTSHGSSKKSKKNSDKGSDEYKKRRERNNIAVRKSREKAKMRSRETEKRVSELMRDNDSLRKRVELLASQMNVLKTLLTNVGVPPESIDGEMARNLQLV